MHQDESKELLDILQTRSIRKGDFTLTSGLKSHYYCDTKATVLSPRGARLCGRLLYELIRPLGAEAVGGMAIGATYLATAIACASDEAHQSDETAPLLFGFAVRPEAKGHGTGAKIDSSYAEDGEPLIRPGRQVIVVDDVVTTAGSLLRAVDAVLEAGADVRGVAAVVDRQAGGTKLIAERGLAFGSLYAADTNGDLSPGQSFS